VCSTDGRTTKQIISQSQTVPAVECLSIIHFMVFNSKTMALAGTDMRMLCASNHLVPCSPDLWGIPSLLQPAESCCLVSALVGLICLAVKFYSSVYLSKSPFLQFSSSVSVNNNDNRTLESSQGKTGRAICNDKLDPILKGSIFWDIRPCSPLGVM
jgi:hypothetical protein